MGSKSKESTVMLTSENSPTSGVTSLPLNPEVSGLCEADVEGGKEEVDRDKWTTKREYLLTVIGYSVGLGNIWRFPYMCQRNGGGAFLIPFCVCLVLCGLPLFLLEAALGQFTGRSAVHVWSVCPLLKGAGWGMILVSAIVVWYYSTIGAWTLYYLVQSFSSTVPWARCDGWWNTPQCTSFALATNTPHDHDVNLTSPAGNRSMSVHFGRNNGTMLYNGIDSVQDLLQNVTAVNSANTTKRVSSSEEFWQHNVLQISSGLEEPGHVVWYLALGLAVTLLGCFLGLVKGIKSSGKVVYVTALLPYVLLTVLLVRGATLPGSGDGIRFYLTPDFSRLLEPKVWVEAALQVFWSLGPGWGGIITMASYNKFTNNCLRDSILLTFVCEGTSVYGGFAIFSVLGYMAHETGLPISKVVSSGPGLAFIVYPEAISLMPLPQLWAVLFFIMLVTVFVDCQFTNIEVVVTTLCDFFPSTVMKRRTAITALYCAAMFLAGLVFVTQGGVYVFLLVDWFVSTLTVTIIVLAECLVVGWIYGADRFSEDFQMMVGRKPPVFFRILWCFFTPLLMLVLFVFTLAQYRPPTYGDYHYGSWGSVLGWLVATVSFLPIPALIVYRLYRTPGALMQRLVKSARPDKDWGPADVTRRKLYQTHRLQRQPRSRWIDVIL